MSTNTRTRQEQYIKYTLSKQASREVSKQANKKYHILLIWARH